MHYENVCRVCARTGETRDEYGFPAERVGKYNILLQLTGSYVLSYTQPSLEIQFIETPETEVVARTVFRNAIADRRTWRR